MRPPVDRTSRRTPATSRRDANQAEEELRAYWGDNVLPLRRDVASQDTTREYLQGSAREDGVRGSGDDVRAAARARLKRARRGRAPRAFYTSLGMLGALGVWVLLLVYSINNLRDYRVFQGLADQRQVQLIELEAQLRKGQQKLAFMQMPQGREQLMMEHGYLRPGDRILMFPSEESSKTAPDENRETVVNVPVAPTPVIVESGNRKTGSAWNRAGDTVGEWYQTLREAAGSSPISP